MQCALPRTRLSHSPAPLVRVRTSSLPDVTTSIDPSALPRRERGLRSRAGNAMGRTRAAVLDGAARAVEKHGARRATMSDIASFAGVANPFSLGRLEPGERVLDLGSGAGTDSLVAAQMVGDEGGVTGVDMTPEMLARARAAAGDMRVTNVEFVEAEAERLPFPDASFDVVISNGVIDLIPDKEAVFAEIFRVLTPGGRIQIADVTIQNPVSAEGRRNIDLWTG